MRPRYWCATADDGWRCQLEFELGDRLVELLRRFAIALLRCEFVERPFEMAHALSDALGLCGRALSCGRSLTGFGPGGRQQDGEEDEGQKLPGHRTPPSAPA